MSALFTLLTKKTATKTASKKRSPNMWRRFLFLLQATACNAGGFIQCETAQGTGLRHPLRAPNLSSAFLRPEIVDQALCKEISLGRVAGPFDNPSFTNFRCSGLGLVLKDGNDWHVIFHLTAPSLNPLRTSVCTDDAINLLHRCSHG